MERHIYYGRKGEPLDMFEWARLFEDRDYAVIAHDELPPTTKCIASRLSTVWLGIDHNWLMHGPPIIFETMRFGLHQKAVLDFPDPEDPNERTESWRYSTEEQASLGHKLILRLIQEKEMQ